MLKKQTKMTHNELKAFLVFNNIKVRPSYCHDDYMFTSVTLPYPLKNKLNRLKKKYNMSRSAVVQMLIEAIEE